VYILKLVCVFGNYVIENLLASLSLSSFLNALPFLSNYRSLLINWSFVVMIYYYKA